MTRYNQQKLTKYPYKLLLKKECNRNDLKFDRGSSLTVKQLNKDYLVLSLRKSKRKI